MKNDDSSKWCRQLECGRTAAQFGTICLFVMSGFAFAQVEPDAAGDAIIDDPRPASRPRPTREQMEQDAQNLRDAAPDIRAREVRILAELDTLTQPDLPEDHWAREWAGEYYVGDGTGMNVRILVAPTAGMTYTWSGCLGLYDGNQGEIVGTFDVDADGRPDGLTIHWALRSHSRYDFDSELFYFVKWDGVDGGAGRHYLVPESQMLDMVNHYNQGGFARDGLYSAPLKVDRAGGGKGRRWSRVPVEGVPQLPDRWLGLLLVNRLDATVTAVSRVTRGNVTNGVDVTRARVTLDKGSDDGLYLGMEISLNRPLTSSGTLTVDKLEAHAAECEFRSFTSAGRHGRPPGVGAVIRVGHGGD